MGQLFSLSVLIQAGYLSKKRERKKSLENAATEVLYIVVVWRKLLSKKLDNMMEDEAFIQVFLIIFKDFSIF